jgi:hypothetical protein
MVRVPTRGLKRLCKTHSITIHARTDARDTAGGQAAASSLFDQTGTSARCFLQPASSSDVVLMMQQGYSITHVLFFASAPGISSGDGIKEGGKFMIARGKAVNVANVDKLWKLFAEETGAIQQDSP